MDINSAYIMKSNNAQLPVKEHMLILDPQTKSEGILGGEQTTFDIPTASGANGQFIDFNSSYLEVNVSFAGADAKIGQLPIGGVHSLIDVVDLESSNFVVEHTDNWSRLRQVLADVNEAVADRVGYKAFVSGQTETFDATQGQPKRLGALMPVTGSSGAYGVSRRFCIPVPSQQLNTGKHLPAHAISKLRYSITWAKPADGCVSVGADADITSFKIDNPRLHLCYLEMSNKSKDVITSKSSMSWSHSLWETHRANCTAAASQSFRYPSHKSSVKTLMMTQHNSDAGVPTTDKEKQHNSRMSNHLLSYQYRINGEYYPQNEVRCDAGGAEAMVELARAFHKVKGKSGLLNHTNFNQPDQEKGLSTFAVAVNTETNTGRSNSSFAGVNTLQESPLLLCKYDSTAVAGEVLLYVQYDGANSIKDGVWRVDN